MATTPGTRGWALFTGVVILLASLITHGHFAGSGDGVHYMVIARSIALDFDLDVANDYADPGSLILGGALKADAHARIGRGGLLRPVHDIGWPALTAPVFAIEYRLAERVNALPERWRRRARLDGWIALRQLVSLTMIGVSGALALALFAVFRAMGHEATTAAVGAAGVMLSPPMLNMSYVYMTEIPTALLVVLAFGMLCSAARHGLVSSFLIGFGAGGLWLLHARNAGLALGVSCLGMARLRGAPLRMFGAGVAAAAGLRIALNLYFWGTVITNPHASLGQWMGTRALVTETGTRLLGIVFDQRHGLLPQAPAYVLGAAGFVALFRRQPRVAAAIGWVVLPYVILIVCPLTNTHGWRGGWSPAARFLVPVAPLLGICVLEAVTHGRARVATLAILVPQIAMAAMFWCRPMMAWAEGPGSAPIFAAVAPPLATALPRWDPAQPGAVWSSTIMVVAAAGMAWAIARPRGRRPEEAVSPSG